ncbi:MAG TPA: guanylate kinase, partial [Thiolinea sp.]|nr:guanylate kinase [Thiolinea sp.]
FILPPGMAALEARLRARAQDDEAVIRNRMLAACSEMSHFDEYDYLIVNEHFDTALDELLAIFRSGRLRLEVQRQRHAALLAMIGRLCD